MSRLSRLRQQRRHDSRRETREASVPLLLPPPVVGFQFGTLGMIIGAGQLFVGISTPGERPAIATMTPEQARGFAIAVITGAYQAEVEAKRQEDLKAQVQAELAAHPSNQPDPPQETPVEPGPAPHTAPSSTGSIIVLPGQ